MSGEVSIYGVFVPSLLLFALGALLVTLALTRLLGFLGFYRFVAYRALVDVCLFVILLGLFARFSALVGLP